MEIIIGSIPPLQNQPQKVPPRPTPMIEAQLLNVRPTRKGIAGPSGRERRNKKSADPLKGKILTIMVPDGSLLPSDIDEAQYEVSIRLVKR